MKTSQNKFAFLEKQKNKKNLKKFGQQEYEFMCMCCFKKNLT